MLTLRQKIFVFSGVVVSLLLVIFFALLYLKQKNNNSNQNSTTTVDQNVVDTNNPNTTFTTINDQVVTKPEGTPEELFVKQMSRFFVERFFTYSNQNDNAHITELQDSVTANMRVWMGSQSQKKDTVYSGVTTNVLSSKLTNFDKASGIASAILEIKQTFSKEVGGKVEQEIIQKTVQVDFRLVNNEWKVDGVWDINS